MMYVISLSDRPMKAALRAHKNPEGQICKSDLEDFMQQNFRSNLGIQEMASLTGRSLATFKRDFKKIFNKSPKRWVQQRRLEEAYFLIRETGKRPSEVYDEVGFETFAHFSFAFKQYFGVTPSSISTQV